MYSALTYFGYGKLICKSSSPLDNGKTVSVSDGKKTWSGTMTDGVCVFNALPYKNKYNVYLINGDDVEYSTEVIFGFGDCQEIDVGLDKTTWKGLKAIVNAGLESEMLAVGDQISATVGGEEQVFDIVHIDYRRGVYGNNIILAKHDCLSSTMQMKADLNNYGGYAATLVAEYLDNAYYDSLPSDMKSVITQMTFQASTGNRSINLQREDHKIWIPLEANITGATGRAASSELATGNAEQFAYFATSANRIKSLGGAGGNSQWWLASPDVGYTTSFCVADTSGNIGSGETTSNRGVCPCFLIAADAE